ncbi:MAG: hypothetical protein QOK35_1308 [Pseudonocardiales bacterium]|nr:hypothetical protein [Pseudonocardiales bacterium]
MVVDAGYPDLRSVDLATGTAAHLDALSRSSGFGSFLTAVTADGSRALLTGSSWVGTADLSAPTKATPALRDPDVLDDGSGMVGVSNDGRNLVVSPLVVGGPTASITRPSTYVPPRGAPAVAVGRSGVVADRVADDRIVLRRLPGLEPSATVVLLDGGTTRMSFDAADRLVTGTDDGRVSWWDARTGTLQHHLDLAGPGPTDPASPLMVTPTGDPDLIAVSGGGGPDVTVRRVDDGRVVDTLPVGGDVDFVSFQRGSDYALVSRPGSTEVWDSRTRRRVVGPLAAEEGTRRVAAMTGRPGQFVVLDDAAGRWHRTTHQVGEPEPTTSVDLGSGVVPGAASADGDVMLLLWPDGVLAGVLRLDPAAWRDELCGTLAGADLTDADRAAHPGIPAGPVCAGFGTAGPPR